MRGVRAKIYDRHIQHCCWHRQVACWPRIRIELFSFSFLAQAGGICAPAPPLCRCWGNFNYLHADRSIHLIDRCLSLWTSRWRLKKRWQGRCGMKTVPRPLPITFADVAAAKKESAFLCNPCLAAIFGKSAFNLQKASEHRFICGRDMCRECGQNADFLSSRNVTEC